LPLRCPTSRLREIASCISEKYTLIYTKDSKLEFVQGGESRLAQVADYTGAAMVYSDHFELTAAGLTEAPVIDYQIGALRDDFDFGGVQLYRSDFLKIAVSEMTEDYEFAALYDLRLRVSRMGAILRVGEFLYYEVQSDSRASGERLFDYVDPRNRKVQIEMEQACTAHLKAVGAYLAPKFKDVDLTRGDFEYEASVIIPCRNRARTIADAIRSALSQECSYKYNVIVVDDNSTDGTVEIIKSFGGDARLIYIAQDETYHAIGGNWNAALNHPKCGRFAIQLDSDDVYSGPDTVQKFIDAFHSMDCAMVIGTYRITDINLQELPPGVIDHKEWTDDNGRNNALRINGLGAPRGFWTPLAREISFPVTKYGEDYAVALRICREYRIGRIWDVVYNCRRWNDNTDSSLSRSKENANNFYKDSIRTWELLSRISLNK